MPETLPRVGIISDERYPSHHTDTQQVIKNACSLARAGLPVELVVPRRAGRSLWSRERRLQELMEFYHVFDASCVTQLLTLPAGEIRPHVKLVHGLAAPLYLASNRFEIAYSRNLLPALLCLGLGHRLIFETYRSFGDEYPVLVRTLASLARHPRFLGLITHSSYSARSFVRRGFAEDRVVVVHNGFDPNDMEPRLDKRQARQRLGLSSDEKLVVYTGNMQADKGMESVIDTAARIPDADFLLVGGQPEHIRRLEAYAASVRAANVHFTGHRPVGEVPAFLYAADVLIVPPTSKPLTQHGHTVLPMKTFTYLAAGRPILAPDLPDLGELLVNGENALLVAPDDPDTAATALRSLIGDTGLQRKLADSARRTAAGLTWDARAEKIKSWLIGRLAV